MADSFRIEVGSAPGSLRTDDTLSSQLLHFDLGGLSSYKRDAGLETQILPLCSFDTSFKLQTDNCTELELDSTLNLALKSLYLSSLDLGFQIDSGLSDSKMRKKAEQLAVKLSSLADRGNPNSRHEALVWLEKEGLPQMHDKLSKRNLPLPAQLRRCLSRSDGKIELSQALKIMDSGLNAILTDDLLRAIQAPDGSVPESWRKQGRLSESAWQSRAAIMLTVVDQSKKLIRAIEHIKKLAPDLKFDLPPGAQLEREQNGQLKNIKLDLPLTLDGSERKDQMKTAALRNWLETEGSKVAAALQEWSQHQYQEGDLAVSGNPAYNMLRSSYEILEANGKIVVSEKLACMKVPFYGWQNLGAKAVKEAILPASYYDPDDLVAVGSGADLNLVKARDLKSVLDKQARWTKAAHLAGAAMDIGICVSGAVGVYSLCKLGLRVAGWGGAARAVGSLALGGTGILENNAWAVEQSKDLSSAITNTRHLVFMAMAFGELGLIGRGTYRWINGVKLAEDAASVPSAVENFTRASKLTYSLAKGADRVTHSGLGLFTCMQITELIASLDALSKSSAAASLKAAGQELLKSK